MHSWGRIVSPDLLQYVWYIFIYVCVLIYHCYHSIHLVWKRIYIGIAFYLIRLFTIWIIKYFELKAFLQIRLIVWFLLKIRNYKECQRKNSRWPSWWDLLHLTLQRYSTIPIKIVGLGHIKYCFTVKPVYTKHPWDQLLC